VITERLVLLPRSYFCYTLTFGICLYFLKSYIIAGGCYIFQNMRKKFIQHLDQIPFLQKFRMVCHET